MTVIVPFEVQSKETAERTFSIGAGSVGGISGLSFEFFRGLGVLCSSSSRLISAFTFAGPWFHISSGIVTRAISSFWFDLPFKRASFFSQDDLVRRKAARDIQRNLLDISIDNRIAGGGGRFYQIACIEAVCDEIVNGRRKMLVEMATGTGKTRTAAALLKRLFEANWATRTLFVVDRNTLAIQTEDAFAEHLPHLPCYRVPRTGDAWLRALGLRA
jgi:type I site-specific restriction endonuclease